MRFFLLSTLAITATFAIPFLPLSLTDNANTLAICFSALAVAAFLEQKAHG